MKWMTLVVLAACAKDAANEPPASPQPAAKGAAKHVETIDLATHTLVKERIGLPMSGKVDVTIDVQNTDDLSKASGTLRFTCPKNCRLGDDKTKLVPSNKRASAFVGDGIDFGHIDFDSFDVVITIGGGTATITKWNVVSRDVDFVVDGNVTLESTLGKSVAALCVRFGTKPALEQRDPKTTAAIQLTGATRSPKDGLFNIKLADRIEQLKMLAMVCDGSPPAPDQAALAVPPPDPSGAPVAPTPVDTPLDPAIAKQIAAAIKKTSPTTFDVDVDAVTKLLADPMIVPKSVRVVPAVRDAKPIGFKVYAIRPGSMFDLLGFSNGDTLTTLNGMPIATPASALEAYTKVRETKPGEKITVTFERRGKTVTHTYTAR
jgi:hypothetical protein